MSLAYDIATFRPLGYSGMPGGALPAGVVAPTSSSSSAAVPVSLAFLAVAGLVLYFALR